MSRIITSVICAVCIVFSFSVKAIGDTNREDALLTLINVQAEKSMAMFDEGLLDVVLLRFRKANAGVSETQWREIRTDVRNMFLRVITEENGPFNVLIREIAPQFSTEELSKLATTSHNDPTFVKFNQSAAVAMKKFNTDLSLRIAIERSVVEINDLLKKRGLNPAY